MTRPAAGPAVRGGPRYLLPINRPLKIYAYDPMSGRSPLNRITVNVLNETLRPGPRGARVEVIDYDGVVGTFYEPVDLDDPAILMQGGLDPDDADPRFHQQMVYAVAMKVIENFEVALGRRFNFAGWRPLKIFPHAFRGANAFYDPHRHALFFGYFAADRDDPGPNIPGQTVFACLSHDVVAHEMTHAVVHRLRRHFACPTNRDVLAFHEAFADIVALFQHFSFPEILNDAIRRTRSDLRDNLSLVSLAQQFGFAVGKGTPLRTAIDEPGKVRLASEWESHRRGSVLVAAVFGGFFQTYQDQIRDLLRIATGGTGKLPDGDIHPDLASRIAREATATASATMRMCMRAFDYLPPVDVTFGDFLRAMITADFELNPADSTGLRRNMAEAFRERGIFPDDADSLSEGALRWSRFDSSRGTLDGAIIEELQQAFIGEAAATSRNSVFDRVAGDTESARPDSQDFKAIKEWANTAEGKSTLKMDPNRDVALEGVHSSFRVALDGQLLVETVIQFVQTALGRGKDEALGGLPIRGGATVIARANGRIQYVIAKPLSHGGLDARDLRLVKDRADAQRQFVNCLDGRDGYSIWHDDKRYGDRIIRRMTIAAQDWRDT